MAPNQCRRKENRQNKDTMLEKRALQTHQFRSSVSGKLNTVYIQ